MKYINQDKQRILSWEGRYYKHEGGGDGERHSGRQRRSEEMSTPGREEMEKY